MFGNGSVLRRIACITSYAEAETRYNEIKPIRGRSADIRPLSPDRKSPDTYRIGKRVHPVLGTLYECVLYNTPVIIFHPDGDVHINMGGWGTSVTRNFIHELLSVSCGRARGNDFLTLKGEGVLMSSSAPTVIRKDAVGQWELVSTASKTEVRLNKAKAKTVREKYKLFEEYLKGVIKLREREETRARYDKGTVIELFNAEYAEAFADEDSSWVSERNAAYQYWRNGLGNKTSPSYKKTCEEFFTLIRPDQPEDEQHNNFYKAFLLLSASIAGGSMIYGQKAGAVILRAKEYPDHYKEVLYKWLSKDVFDEIQLPMGKIPNNKYRDWM